MTELHALVPHIPKALPGYLFCRALDPTIIYWWFMNSWSIEYTQYIVGGYIAVFSTLTLFNCNTERPMAYFGKETSVKQLYGLVVPSLNDLLPWQQRWLLQEFVRKKVTHSRLSPDREVHNVTPLLPCFNELWQQPGVKVQWDPVIMRRIMLLLLPLRARLPLQNINWELAALEIKVERKSGARNGSVRGEGIKNNLTRGHNNRVRWRFVVFAWKQVLTILTDLQAKRWDTIVLF